MTEPLSSRRGWLRTVAAAFACPLVNMAAEMEPRPKLTRGEPAFRAVVFHAAEDLDLTELTVGVHPFEHSLHLEPPDFGGRLCDAIRAETEVAAAVRIGAVPWAERPEFRSLRLTDDGRIALAAAQAARQGFDLTTLGRVEYYRHTGLEMMPPRHRERGLDVDLRVWLLDVREVEATEKEALRLPPWELGLEILWDGHGQASWKKPVDRDHAALTACQRLVQAWSERAADS